MRVDFYLLSQTEPDAFWLMACRLLEKAYLKNHRVFVYCAHQHDAEHLDELLWTFKPDSFIPHHLQGEGPEPPPPIQIGYPNQTEPRGFTDILLNLTHTPDFFARFDRIMEIIASDEPSKHRGRENFRKYKPMTDQIHTHQMA